MDSRLIEERRFSTDEPSEALWERLIRTLEEMGFKVTPTDGVIVANRGSVIFVRLFGAFFAPSRRLPMSVEAQASGSHSLTVRISENWGWGIRYGLDEVYKPLFEEILRELQHKLRARSVEDRQAEKVARPIVRSSRRRLRFILGFMIVSAAVAILFGLIDAIFSR